MKCSVVIPTYQRARILAETLDALGRQTSPDFDVIVVSDGEDLETRVLAKTYRAAYPLRWIFNPKNQGQASARNTGALAAGSDILLFLDDDTTPVPDCIEQHLNYHGKFAKEANLVVLGKITHKYSQPPNSHTERILREIRDRSLAEFEAAVVGRRLEFGKVVACGLNASIRRTTFLALGGFDASLNYVDEDSEFGARLYDQGVRFEFAPAALVVHHDTKDLVRYGCEIMHRSGRNDLYRRREKKQWNDRIQLLAQMHGKRWWREPIHRLAWHLPWIFQSAAELCRKMTDTTGSRQTFRLWSKLGIGDYWKGIKAEGETINSLREVVGAPVPVLMFHSVSTPTRRNLWSFYLSPGKFSRFVSWLKLAGYCSVLPQEWLAGECVARSVILTFDDAYDDFYAEAFPLLEKHGFRSTVFVVVDRIGQTNLWDQANGFPSRSLLSAAQIRDLHQRGVQFGSHTLTHRLLTTLSDKELDRELRDSKQKLEDFLGSEVTCISYPWGGVDGRVRAAAARAGYKIGLTTEDGLNHCEDPLCLKRANVCEIDNLTWFTLKLWTGLDLRQRALEHLVNWGLHPGWDEVRGKASDVAMGSEPDASEIAVEDALPGTRGAEP